MNQGAEMAHAQPQDGELEWVGERPWEEAADPDAYNVDTLGNAEVHGSGIGLKLFAGLLILLALGWVGACA